MTHRRLIPFAAIAALTLVLAACQVTIAPGPTWPPTFVATVDAQTTFPPTSQADGSVAPGATRYFAMDVAGGRDLVYAAVSGDTGLRVSILTAGGTRLAVSDSATYFVGSVAELSASAAAVAASSISVTVACPGPCAAVPVTASSYVVAVSNPTASSLDFDLFTFTIDETDQNEPNDTEPSATVLNGAGSDQGAIEVLGDADYFEYNATAGGNFFVVFTPFSAALGLRLDFPNCPTCEVLDGTTGMSVEGLVDGDVLRVRSTSNRAGPSSTAGYSIEITATPPAGATVSTR